MASQVSDIQLNLFIPKAKPFLKWAGGKTQLLQQMDRFFPIELVANRITSYHEPFIGGGAVFFHLRNTSRLPEKVYLFDNNEELINTYQVIRDNVDELIDLLSIHKIHHNKEYFYEIRGLDRNGMMSLSNTERAARTIYLNRTCYNGLYRVNSQGQFNAPMGSYKNPQILYKDVLLAASAALHGVIIETRDYQAVLEFAKQSNFVYFDPPYDPVSETASFTGYTADNFREKDQRNLAEVYKVLSERGCYCMLSNSRTPLILDLYKDYRIEIVKANRAINSDPNSRGAVDEVLVLNY